MVRISLQLCNFFGEIDPILLKFDLYQILTLTLNTDFNIQPSKRGHLIEVIQTQFGRIMTHHFEGYKGGNEY